MTADNSPVPFEEALRELERIVRELEDGDLGLDDAMARYEQGVRLIRQCQGRLQEAELRIVALTGTNDEGPTGEPFAFEPTVRNGAARKKR